MSTAPEDDVVLKLLHTAYCTDLPGVLLNAVRRLRQQAEAADPAAAQVARRALFHLYQVSRKAS
jgi:hypothetical protein